MNSDIAIIRAADVVKPDSITTNQCDFLATHVPLKTLVHTKVFEINPKSDTPLSEEKLYQDIIANHDNKHQFIIIHGDSGTGKSHLIRWFKTRFDNEKPSNEVVLFIRRSDNTLKGTIGQLLESKEIGQMANKEAYKRLVKAGEAVAESKLKDMIYQQFLVEIYDDIRSGKSKSILEVDNRFKQKFVAFLNNTHIRKLMMSEDGPIERIYSKINSTKTFVDRDTIAEFKEQDFRIDTLLIDKMRSSGADRKAISFCSNLLSDSRGDKYAQKSTRYLNLFVEPVIQRCAGIEPGDFEQIFMDIRRSLYQQEKNLTVFIEDITSFTGIDNALLNALIVDHTGEYEGLCRISSVVGGTTPYIETNFRDNYKDRITDYIYIPKNAFDQSGLYEFVGRYLNAMSLKKETLDQWIADNALPDEYPIHDLKEGVGWEEVDIGNNKKLNLYPFTRHSINYLYEHKLTHGFKTPRYIIRDLIESVVNNVIYDKDNFPSKEFSPKGSNPELEAIVNGQIANRQEAERLIRFLVVWGTGEPSAAKSTTDELLIAGLKETMFTEFSLPLVDFQQTTTVDDSTDIEIPILPPEETEAFNKVDLEKKSKFDAVNEMILQWSREGKQLEVGGSSSVTRDLTRIREAMCDFLFDAIDWQSEGVSFDTVTKVRGSNIKLLFFENQARSEGLYKLPSKWETEIVMVAFLRRFIYGNDTWDYEGADLDIYNVIKWMTSIKRDIIEVVGQFNDQKHVDYIEPAICSEIFRQVLTGGYKGATLRGYDGKNLLNESGIVNKQTHHCDKWNSLAQLIQRNDRGKINKETIKNYFNIVQGTRASGMVVLNALKLNEKLKHVKRKRLVYSEDELDLQSQIKKKAAVFKLYQDIVQRIDTVAEEEKKFTKVHMAIINNAFENTEITEEDLEDLLQEIDDFYSYVNKAQINMRINSTDEVKKHITNTVNAVNIINETLEKDDTLEVLMAFSSDPLQYIIVLEDLITKVSLDSSKVNTIATNKIRDLEDYINNHQNQISYEDQKQKLMKMDELLQEMRN